MEAITYRDDLIRGAIAARQLTTEKLAEQTGLAPATISAIRNGSPNVKLQTLHTLVEALGLTLHEVFEPKPEEELTTV